MGNQQTSVGTSTQDTPTKVHSTRSQSPARDGNDGGEDPKKNVGMKGQCEGDNQPPRKKLEIKRPLNPYDDKVLGQEQVPQDQ